MSSRFTAKVLRPRRAANRGSSLVEILVTLIIVAIGLLGLAATQAAMQTADVESYQRSQALVLIEDMLDRINANRYAAQCYAITTSGSGSSYVGAAGSGHLGTPACTLGSVTAEQLAQANTDLQEWNDLLNGTAETRNGSDIGAMSGARGCVAFDALTGTYTIVVSWQGRNDTFAPVVSCANGLYGAETQRRAVWLTLSIADLM
jgi:type IV pilus assembly protein PilV